jgi:RPA family protein
MLRPAKGLFAFEFNESNKYGSDGYLSPLGEVFDMVSVAGVVTAIDISRVSGKVTVRVSDPTGVFLVDAGKKDLSTGRLLSGVQVPSFVSVTGTAENVSGGGMQIVAEAAISIEKSVRDSWTCTILRETLERMETVLEGEYSGSIKELCRYTCLMGRVLEAVGSSGVDESPKSPDYSEKILEMIEIHSDKKGMPVDDLIRACRSLGLNEADIKRTIESLVEEGECYLPTGGYIRRL